MQRGVLGRSGCIWKRRTSAGGFIGPNHRALLVRTRRRPVGSCEGLKFAHLLVSGRPLRIKAGRSQTLEHRRRTGGHRVPKKPAPQRRREALLGQQALSRLEVGEEALDLCVAVEAVELLGDVVVEEFDFG